MAFQATVTLLGLTSSAATAAVLCALVLMWWVLVLCAVGAGRRVVGGLHASAKEFKPDPFVNDAPTPLLEEKRRVEAGPTDLDLRIDFEAFHSQIRHDFEAFQAQIGRRFDLIFQDLGIDFEAFQAQIGRRCDLELDALCETAMDDQSAQVLQDLEDEFRGGPVGTQARCQSASAEPRMDFEANAEPQCDKPFEDTRDQGVDAIDGALDFMHAATLRAFEDGCGGSGALGDDAQGDHEPEMGEAPSGHAAEERVLRARSVNAGGTCDVAADEDKQLSLFKAGYANQPALSVNRTVVCHVRWV